MIYVVVGSLQTHAAITTSDKICPCLTSAMGEGGGMIPVLIWKEEKKDDPQIESSH